MKVQSIGIFFVAIAFFVAPFLWSYVGSLGGFLVRAVDIAFVFILVLLGIQRKVIVYSIFFFACFVSLIVLSMLRSVIFSDTEAMVSAVKISFYLSSALACSTFLSLGSQSEIQKATRWALLAISPFYAYFVASILWTLGDLIASGAIFSPSQFVFRFWNSIFAVNIFGFTGLEEFKGVSFRNTGGIGFLVLSLFFFWVKGRPNILFVISFIVAALFFSRSVWLCQLVFITFLAVKAPGFSRLFTLAIVAVATSVLLFSDFANEAVSDRLESDVGRIEMIGPALEELGKSFLIGGEKGAGLFERNGVTTDLHNVPLSFGLKSGALGLIFASLIPLYFAWEAMVRIVKLFHRRVRANENIVAIALCVILFMRPLISGSHDVYFSVGEWLALSLLFAIKQREVSRLKVTSAQLPYINPPAMNGVAGPTRHLP